jgi:hypothetical protein
LIIFNYNFSNGTHESKVFKKISDNEESSEDVYKIAESSMTIKTSKSESSGSKSKIWPPPPKLRAASSLVALNEEDPNYNKSNDYKNPLSQSTFFLNKSQTMEHSHDGKLKRKKWYSVFLPPKIVKIKNIKMEPEPKKEKRAWYKTKKKEKVAVTC